MRIDVRELKHYSKLITKFVDTSHPQFSSLYLDFEGQCIYFGSNRGFGKVTMPVTDYDSNVKPFCVNALSFIAVAEAVSLLDVEIKKDKDKKDCYVFRHESGDSFQIAYTDPDDFELPKFDIDFSDAIALNKDYIPCIRRASVFTSPDGAKNLDGVFVRNGSMIGFEKLRMYEEVLSGVDINDNLILPRNVWEILVIEDLDEPKIKIDENCIWIIATDVTMQFPVNRELFLPEEIGGDAFRANYQSEYSVRLNKNALSNMIQFFLPFVSNVVQQRLQFIFNATSLEIKTEDGNIISRHIPYSEAADTSYFKGNKIWVSAMWLKNILSCLPNPKDAVVEIAVDFKKPPLVFSIVGDNSTHIIYSRIKDSA